MPLFMDLHKLPHISVDVAKKAHVADEKIQRQYGVKYHQFWVNEEAGNLFCLVEGPDKETVENVHRLAHGHVACAVVEVDPSYYSLIMGNNIRVDQGLALHESGHIDTGDRFVMVVSLLGKTSSNARQVVIDQVSKNSGRPVKLTGEDSLINVFDSASQALQTARVIQKMLARDRSLSFRIALSAGQPVTENNEFIEETMRLARRLNLIAEDGYIVTSALFKELCDELAKGTNKNFRTITSTEESFLTDCFSILEPELSNEDFNIDSLVKAIGISRAQLYRKIHALAGKAPNNFIRDLRLEKAMTLLKRKSRNISEVAYDVGFSNPSYFAKCFSQRFGQLPSQVE